MLKRVIFNGNIEERRIERFLITKEKIKRGGVIYNAIIISEDGLATVKHALGNNIVDIKTVELYDISISGETPEDIRKIKVTVPGFVLYEPGIKNEYTEDGIFVADLKCYMTEKELNLYSNIEGVRIIKLKNLVKLKLICEGSNYTRILEKLKKELNGSIYLSKFIALTKIGNASRLSIEIITDFSKIVKCNEFSKVMVKNIKVLGDISKVSL